MISFTIEVLYRHYLSHAHATFKQAKMYFGNSRCICICTVEIHTVLTFECGVIVFSSWELSCAF